MSTFLDLCQDLRQETTDSGSGPSTVLDQVGELGRMVRWIRDAWKEIQTGRPDWLWMRRQFTVNTVASTDAYAYGSCTDTTTSALITRFSRWYEGFDKNGFPYFSAYLTSTGASGQFPLMFLEWDTFRRLYKFGAQNNGQPVHYTVRPDRRFVLGPVPDDIYTVNGDYQLGPQILAEDDDEPEMPSEFHDLIKYEGMSKYGGNRVAPEAMLRAVSEGSRVRASLEISQLPSLTFGGPLA